MFDLFGLAKPTEDGRVQWFIGNGSAPGTAASQGFQVWMKPRGVRFVSIWCLGAGGGGGGGASNAAGSAKGGGGGGGSGALSRMIFNASDLPDSLYIYTALGGVGATGNLGVANGNAAGTTGDGIGKRSFVLVYPDSAFGAANLLMASGAADANTITAAGGGTTVPAGGSGGSASTIATTSTATLGNCAISQLFLAGVAGTSGGGNAAGTALTISTGLPITGGTGGGGGTAAANAGGAISAVASTLLLASAGGTSGAAPTNGNNGFWRRDAMFGYGATGGGSTNTAATAGANGGYGAIPGAGGGGGGAGVSAGGRGGDGGPGLVVIRCW